MATNTLERADRDGVSYLTLNRPEKRHALSVVLLGELAKTLREIGESSNRAVVLGSTGNVFCAGHDLSEMIGNTRTQYHELFALCSQVMQQLRQLPQPVIARVQGVATAAGCQLVAACDLAVAAETATFATPGVRIGLFCTTPMVPLVRAIPPKPALEMLLTGQAISASQALQWGLVNRVVPSDQLDVVVEQWCQAICSASPAVVQLGKRAFYQQLHLDESAAYDLATEVMTDNALLADAQEGMSAFLQKRRPQWGGDGAAPRSS